MKIASYVVRGRPSFGAVVDDGVIDLRARLPRFRTLLDVLKAGALEELKVSVTGVRPDFPLSELQLQPPVVGPEKILCVGVNYANRNAEYKDSSEQPKYPSLFFRVPDSFVGHDRSIVRPTESEQLDYEGEIVLVIGRHGRRVPKEAALGYICGYTLCNEGTIRDWVRHAKFNVTQGKNWDASGSIGPWMVTADEIDPNKPLQLTTKVNGEIRQDDTTANLIFGFADLIAYVTTFMSIKPGDMIVSGTPVGAGARFDPPRWLKQGDVIEVTVPEIGTLRNAVMGEK